MRFMLVFALIFVPLANAKQIERMAPSTQLYMDGKISPKTYYKTILSDPRETMEVFYEAMNLIHGSPHDDVTKAIRIHDLKTVTERSDRFRYGLLLGTTAVGAAFAGLAAAVSSVDGNPRVVQALNELEWKLLIAHSPFIALSSYAGGAASAWIGGKLMFSPAQMTGLLESACERYLKSDG